MCSNKKEIAAWFKNPRPPLGRGMLFMRNKAGGGIESKIG